MYSGFWTVDVSMCPHVGEGQQAHRIKVVPKTRCVAFRLARLRSANIYTCGPSTEAACWHSS